MEENIIKCVLENSFDWVAFLTSITSVINLLLVYWIFKKERSNEKSNMLLDYNIAWYRLINVEERVNNINNYVFESIREMNELNVNPEQHLNKRKELSTKIILDFRENIIKEKNKVTTILKPLNEESNILFSKLLNDLCEIQSNEIQQSILQQSSIDISNLEIKKDEIITKYYDIGKEILKR